MIEIVGWRGDRVSLLPLERGRHLENAYRWLNDPESTAHVQVNLGVTWRQEEAFFDRAELNRQDDSSGASTTKRAATSASSVSTASTGSTARPPAAS